MKSLAKFILAVEPILLAIAVIAYWFAELTQMNTPILLIPLVALIPPGLARLILYRRLWINTPLNLLLYLFLLLCAANTYFALSHPDQAPYSWGWFELGRPIVGVVVALSIASIVYERNDLNGSVLAIVLLGILVGVLGLTSAQYIGKSEELQFLINHIPVYTNFPGAVGGFNVNEIGGAMTFFAPLTLGLALYDWRARRTFLPALIATIAFLMIGLALFLGQSRLALIGAVLGIALVILIVIPRWRWRIVAYALLAVFCLIEFGIATDVFVGKNSSGLSTPAFDQRDTQDLAQRPEIWKAAIALIEKYPLTGYGLNEFRRPEIRNEYVSDFAMVIVPHAHNEFLEVGVDAGVPGLLLYIAWTLVLAYMLWQAWRKGTPWLKAMAAAIAGGLIAHTIFGMADAITMYDRFGFLYWLFVGLAGGVYALATRREVVMETAVATAPTYRQPAKV